MWFEVVVKIYHSPTILYNKFQNKLYIPNLSVIMIDSYFLVNRKLTFCPYVQACYPDTQTCMQMVDILVQAGAKILELGIPFSDPAADWPVLTQINHESVAKGITIIESLEFISQVKKKYPDLGICIMTYFNPVYQYGVDKFVEYLATHHIDSYLIPDLPVWEIWNMPDHPDVTRTMLVSDNLDDKTILDVVAHTSWYLYVLSSVTITWGDLQFQSVLWKFIERLRLLIWTEKKLVVWFWIKSSEHINFLRTIDLDGFIIWSEIVKQFQQWGLPNLKEYISNLKI